MITSEFILESPAFKNNEKIPAKYTCEGSNVSPPLKWIGVPKGTKSFVLIVDDPDAPDPAAPKMTWVHWVLFNIPANVNSLAEDIHRLPSGVREGLNDWKRTSYGGPCPPIGQHHYIHKLYALDTVLPELGSATKSDLEKAMKGHILAQTRLVATYKKEN